MSLQTTGLSEIGRVVLKGIRFLIVAVSLLVICGWLFISPPGTDHFIAYCLYLGAAILALATLWNRLLLLSAALVVLALYPPLFAAAKGMIDFYRLDAASYAAEDWKITALPDGQRPLAVHLSDPHFIDCKQPECFTREGDKWDPALLQRVVREIIRLRPRYLIVSGDITDRGDADQWSRAEWDFLKPVVQAGTKIVMVPGNHDIQPFFNPSQYQRAGSQLRNFLESAVRTDPGLRIRDSEPLQKRMQWKPSSLDLERSRSRQYQACLDLCMSSAGDASRPPRGCPASCDRAVKSMSDESLIRLAVQEYSARACAQWYPMTYVDSKDGIAFVALCSGVSQVETMGTNAIGELGEQQVEQLRKMLEKTIPVAKRIFVVVHHPLVKRSAEDYGGPESWWSRKAIFASSAFEFATLTNSLPESKAVVGILRDAAKANPGVSIHLAFGHRHGSFSGKIDQKNGKHFVWVTEAPAAFKEDGGMWIAYEMPNDHRLSWRWWGQPSPSLVVGK